MIEQVDVCECELSIPYGKFEKQKKIHWGLRVNILIGMGGVCV